MQKGVVSWSSKSLEKKILLLSTYNLYGLECYDFRILNIDA